MLTAIVLGLSAVGCRESMEPAEQPRTLSGPGLQLTVPAAWDGRAYLVHDVTPVVEAASFPLPPVGVDVPKDPPAAALGGGGIYLALIDMGSVRYGGVPVPSPVSWTEATLPVAVRESDLETSGLLSVASRYLVIGHRAYSLRIALGPEGPLREQLDEANAVLSSLSLEDWLPTTCPPNWPGPWTVCPEARWVGRVAERAGYRIVDETGSALVVEGQGRGFYIHATRMPRMTEQSFAATSRRGRLSPAGTVEGVEIFGYESQRRSWLAQQFVFWITPGPPAAARLPAVAEMGGLVRASLDLPAPDH